MRVYTDGELDVVWAEDGLHIRRDGATRQFTGVPRHLAFELFEQTWLVVLPSRRSVWLSTPLTMHPEWGAAIIACDLESGATTALEPTYELAAFEADMLVAGSRASFDRAARKVVREPYLARVRLIDGRLEEPRPPSVHFPSPIRAAWPTDGAGAIWKHAPWSDEALTTLTAPSVSPAGACAVDRERGLVVRLDPDGSVDVLRAPREPGTETRLSAVASSHGVLVANDYSHGSSALCHFDRGGRSLGAITWQGLATEPCALEGERLLIAHEMSDFTSRLRLWLLDTRDMTTIDEHVTELLGTNGYPTLSVASHGSRWLLGDGVRTLAGTIVGDMIRPEGP